MPASARFVWVLVLASCAAGGGMTRDDKVNGDGELRLGSAVDFVVRPLAGPGSMGPREVSPESDAALEELRAWLAAHPGKLRIEVAVNPRMMSGMPDAGWGAHLAGKVAAALVARGVDCHRLEAVGLLDDGADAPGEKVRFFVAGRGPARPQGTARDPWATEDPCKR